MGFNILSLHGNEDYQYQHIAISCLLRNGYYWIGLKVIGGGAWPWHFRHLNHTSAPIDLCFTIFNQWKSGTHNRTLMSNACNDTNAAALSVGFVCERTTGTFIYHYTTPPEQQQYMIASAVFCLV